MSWIYALTRCPSDGVSNRFIGYASACRLQQLSVCDVSIVQMKQNLRKELCLTCSHKNKLWFLALRCSSALFHNSWTCWPPLVQTCSSYWNMLRPFCGLDRPKVRQKAASQAAFCNICNILANSISRQPPNENKVFWHTFAMSTTEAAAPTQDNLQRGQHNGKRENTTQHASKSSSLAQQAHYML